MSPPNRGEAEHDGTHDMGLVVVNYGSSPLLRQYLAAASELGAHVRVVVVDNRSTVEERGEVTALAAEQGWDLVTLPDNRGFGAATNAGFARARELGCATFCCLNPDASVPPDVLEELRLASLADPLAVIAPRIVNSAGVTVFEGSTLGLDDGRTAAPHSPTRSRGPVEEWLTGACLVVSAEMIDRLDGGYDEGYFLYWEDVDLSHRALAAGGSLVVRSDLVAVHDEGGTQGTREGGAKSDLYYRYNCRNRLLFAARNLPRRQLLKWIVRTPRVSWEILLRGGRRQLLHSPKPLVAAVRGSLEGLGIALVALVRQTASRSVRVQHAPARGDLIQGATERAALPSARRSPDAGPVRVTVAVPTFGRPNELRDLLPQLLDQVAEVTAGGQYTAEILVVDNDPARSAAAVAAAVSEVRYVVEATPGIAAVRNRALDEAAASRLLAFIDDDEWPCIDWLAALLRTWAGSGAAAVSGRILPDYTGPVDPWILAGDFFVRRRMPTGTEIDVAAAGNLLLDLAQVRAAGTRFDAALGLAAGEDTLFSRSLVHAGARMVWCDESAAVDLVPVGRLTRRWVLTRAWSHGNAAVLTELRLTAAAAARLRIRIQSVLRGLLRLGGGGARWVLGLATGSEGHQAGGARSIFRGIGMIGAGLGVVYEEYARDGRRWRIGGIRTR
ncbi:glycosyltransferase family 2 protein [Naasia sp. SYSU D00948]|uniref:glycosyltransferase family 2 protein n=1 Tax=Naasia sp. SYSU D00948 TaxID=2817379 RepID=UPI001FEFB081|nr:glycosyltransferase family 2 protein [Naasia sp. SYSU D00948]